MSLITIKTYFLNHTLRSFRCSRNIRLFNTRIYNKPSYISLEKFRNSVNKVFNYMLWNSLKVLPYQLKALHSRCFCISSTQYEELAEETLQSIYEYFEDILEDSNLNKSDVNYSNGVLTVSLDAHGVYVLNKQTPSKQIWLSSPVSGPKRYDYIDGKWIYKRDGSSLSDLLNNEISRILGKEVSTF